jgi:hypothetical protein
MTLLPRSQNSLSYYLIYENFWGWEMKQPLFRLNCFGDEKWSNLWFRTNRHPSRHPSSLNWCLSVRASVCSPRSQKKITAQFVQVLNETQIRVAAGASRGGTRGGPVGGGGGQHQCLSWQRTQRVHASVKLNFFVQFIQLHQDINHKMKTWIEIEKW